MTVTAPELWKMSRKELGVLLQRGHAIDPGALDDTEYRGVSLGLPSIIERLSWKTFKKVFHRDPETGALRGWNIRLEQTGVDGPPEPLRDGDGQPRTFGHYHVTVLPQTGVPMPVGPGLLIDYGLGENGLDPIARLRDPIVAINEGSADLLHGWSYVDLGFRSISTPSFFSLERDCRLTHVVVPPGRR